MKASMYFNYTSRSLMRGGQRTILAVFCVAVGVIAIVALQLAGLMINNALIRIGYKGNCHGVGKMQGDRKGSPLLYTDESPC